jgi:hypothetical protein
MPRRMENQEFVSPWRQCSRTPVDSSQGFLSKEKRDNTGASSILSWPGPSWFLPAVKGRGFCGATDIIKNAKEELKRLSQNGFQECNQHNSLWWKCGVAQGDYFERNVAEITVVLCSSQKQEWFRNYFKFTRYMWKCTIFGQEATQKLSYTWWQQAPPKCR